MIDRKNKTKTTIKEKKMLSKTVLRKINENGILLIGCGGKMGHHYMEKLKNLEVWEGDITGIDINPENLKKVKAKYPGASFFTGWEDFMEPACAIITANSTAHLSVIKECCRRDIKNIFIEKPLVYYQHELDELDKLVRYYDDLNLFTAYLINYSMIVDGLMYFLNGRDLSVAQAFAKWGKNWPGEKRIMGGDAEEETPHPLGLILAIIKSFNGDDYWIKDVTPSISKIPHVQKRYLKNAHELELGFPETMNDSTLAGINISTNYGVVPVHLTTSFNFVKQIRMVEISFRSTVDIKDGIPTIKALMEFDVDPLAQIIDTISHVSLCQRGYPPANRDDIKNLLTGAFGEKSINSLNGSRDRLTIIDAESNEIIFASEYKGDKIQANLDAGLEALLGEHVDSRLMGYQSAKNVTEIILGIAG